MAETPVHARLCSRHTRAILIATTSFRRIPKGGVETSCTRVRFGTSICETTSVKQRARPETILPRLAQGKA
eukprot:2510814-Amphidinium_carterae.1